NELFRRGKTIGVAESVTGGGVADSIVAMAGASRAFRGGIVAYDNAVKQSLLGVRAETLDRFGAVSEETAVEMARGARAALGADFALATTGIAGPEGGGADKPVGLVWFALVDDTGEATTHRGTFPGSRADVLTRATMTALSLIWRRLEGHP
ncbi:MAG TPA: nicotinamide-nucleotide amidohydrolase family protein, partial [Candidatus Lustribacter sp.]|nr:nicotinamide-nucleotide amidohydrolase family protein [Candidatus Lustribacter sp.]